MEARPYIGLDFFAEEQADRFFGRAEERRTIIGNLRASRLTLLHAESGVGKSSLLRAGVAARLLSIAREAAEDGESPEYLPVVFSVWPDDPLTGLIEELEAVARPFVAGELELSRDHLDVALEQVAGAVGTTPLVILDQFEEFFLYHHRGSDGERLADEVARCIARPDLRANFLISIREDAYSRIGDLFSTRLPNIYANYLHLDHLGERDARAAIREPIGWVNRQVARDERYAVDDELVNAVLAQVERPGNGDGNGHRRFETAYLQLVMERVWDAEVAAESRTLRRATFDSLGGGSRILETHLAEAMARLEPHERRTASEALRFLVTSAGTKIALTSRDLAEYTHLPQAELETALDKLEDARILRPDSTGGIRRFELYHDVLGDAAVEWRKRREAERQKDELRERLHAEAQKRRTRFLRASLVALAGVVVVLTVAVGWALLERGVADRATHRARSQTLAASAMAKLSVDPELSVLLASAAVRQEPTKQADEALRRALAESPVRGRFDIGQAVDARIDARAGLLATIRPHQVSLWQPASGAAIMPPQKLDGEFDGAAAIAAGGGAFAIGSDRATLVLRPGSRPGRVRLAGGDAMSWMALSADGAYAAGLDRYGHVGVWNARTGARLATWRSSGYSRVPDAGAFDPRNPHRLVMADCDGGKLLIASLHGTALRMRSLLAPARAKPGKGRQQALPCAITVSPDGRRAVETLMTGSARVWDLARGRTLVPRLADVGTVDAVAWSPDSRHFAVAAGKSATIYAARTGRRMARAADHADELNSVAFSPSGRLIVTAGSDAVAKVSDVETGALIAELHGHTDWIFAAAFLPSGRDIVTVSADGTARRWRLPTGRILRGDRDWVLDAEFTDAEHVLTAGEDGVVRLWNLLTGRSVRMSGHTILPTTSVTSLAVTRDGTRFVTAGDDTSNSGQVLIGDARTGKVVDEIVPDVVVLDVALSPDGTRLLTTSRWGPAEVRDLYGKHKTLATLPLGLWQWAIRASYSPDGRWIVTAGYDGAARIFDAHTFKPVKVLRRRGALYGAVFSPDSRRLLTYGADATAQLWDLRGRSRAPIVLSGHTGIVDAGAFSPRGARVVTGSVDRTTRVWDARTGQLLSTQRMHSDIVNSVAFSPDGNTILSASDDHTARLYPCQTCVSDDSLLQLARRRVFRGLTPAEKAEYGESLNTG